MSKKFDKELMELDLYEILGLSFDADESKIKKSYRKNALACHPDKNPDKPSATAEFNRLKKILEILLDPGARHAYDRVLKGRKAAAIRAREADSKTQQLKDKLEKREKAFKVLQQTQAKLTEEERLRRELKRLEEEGEAIIEEELDKVNKLLQEEIQSAFGVKKKTDESKSQIFRVKAIWRPTDEWKGYTQEEIHQLFYKWGEINAVVMKQREAKGTALIDYKEQMGADMAVQFEKGMINKPLEVTSASSLPEPKKKNSEKTKKPKNPLDYESVSEMNRRRQQERLKLIEEMKLQDGLS